MIEVVATPPLNTVQDRGRPGYRRIGLCQGGAMDEPALRLCNLMVGNEEGAAAIELQTFPVRLRTTAEALVAVTGAAAAVRVDGLVVPASWSMRLPAGGELAVGHSRIGARVYVGIAGGIAVEPVLGSRSTDLRSGFGGFEDRNLRAGDRLPTGAPSPFDVELAREGFGVEAPIAALQLVDGDGTICIRVLVGPEHDEFDESSRTSFWNDLWTVTLMSDRMGMRLAGARTLIRRDVHELRSGGILPGVVQVPPSGEPLIQLRDGNSAGGYPRIGVVAEADLWRLAQARAGARLRFVRTGHADAVAAAGAVVEYLAAARRQIVAIATPAMVPLTPRAMPSPDEAPSPGPQQVRTQTMGRFLSRAPLADRPMVVRGDVVAAGQILAFVKTGTLLRPIRACVAGLLCAVHRQEDEMLARGDVVFEIEAHQ